MNIEEFMEKNKDAIQKYMDDKASRKEQEKMCKSSDEFDASEFKSKLSPSTVMDGSECDKMFNKALMQAKEIRRRKVDAIQANTPKMEEK